MSQDGRTTSQQLYIPTLLVVGGCEALLARCRHAARSSGLAIKTCLLDEVAAEVPLRHPLAIVVPNDVFDHGHELDALARDVRSVLFRVDAEVSVRELEAMMAAAIAGSSSQRERRVTAGRYSLVDGIEDEAPFSRRSSLPSALPSSRAQGLVRGSRPAPAPLSSRGGALSSAALLTMSADPPSSSRVAVRPAPSPLPSSAPGVVSTRAPRAQAITEPPLSGPQPSSASGSFAALRAMFATR